MDTKQSIDTSGSNADRITITHINSPMPRSRTSRRSRVLAAVLLVSFVFGYSLFHLFVADPNPIYEDYMIQNELEGFDFPKATSDNGLVPLEAHIISKCPDTRDAMRKLILPAMQRISDKVDFKLTYIGKTAPDDGVECKHGPSECMGNIIELCARELYPDPKISLGFVMCLTKDYEHIPERALVEDCALEHAIDFSALNECATRDDGAHGMGMLRESVERSAELGVTTSCTIRLNDEVYCVRDDGKWKDCPHGSSPNDLVIAIEKIYRNSQV